MSQTLNIRAPECKDTQPKSRRPLWLGVSVQLTGSTSPIPQVDTFFLHMLDPQYTSLSPAFTHLVLLLNIFLSLLLTSNSKVSKNVFGTSR